jgi:hypothetical protein
MAMFLPQEEYVTFTRTVFTYMKSSVEGSSLLQGLDDLGLVGI